MDGTEFGAYMLLVIACYQSSNHRLPDDDARLARMARVSRKVWARIRPAVMHKFIHIREGELTSWEHFRVRKEVEKYTVRCSTNRDNALNGWESRKQVASESLCERIANPNPLPISIKPPTPLPGDKPGGVLKNGSGKGGFNIEHHLSDKDREAVKRAAPTWDMHRLFSIYNEGRESRGIPDHPARAFLGWVKKYTKGKQL